MTALNFPNNPTVGQIYTNGDKSWTWTGQAWAIVRTAAQGASAYDLAVQNGFVGTQAQWIASLKGATGSAGSQGPAGGAGAAGPKGDAGTPGTNGTNGTSGTNGVGVPAGGGAGMVLSKNSNSDFDTHWTSLNLVTDYTVPLGGSTGQFLGKTSPSDGAFSWLNLPASGTTSAPELPAGGNVGQVLTKNSISQGDVSWQNIPNQNALPDGGTENMVLAKNSSTNGDVRWAVNPALPAGGTPGQFLSKNSTTDGDVSWATPVQAISLPAGGTSGQVLVKNSSANGDASWTTETFGGNTGPSLPVGGTTGQFLVKNSTTDGDAGWATEILFPEAPNDGQLYARQNKGWAAFSIVGSGTGSGSSGNITPTASGPSGRTGAYTSTYWRIHATGSQDGNGTTNGYVDFSNLEFRSQVGATQRATGGSSFSDNYYSSNNADMAFDGNNGTTCISDSTLPWNIGYHFATAQAVVEVAIRNRADGYNTQSVSAFDLQISDDGITWTTIQSYTGIDWANTLQTKTFGVALNPSAIADAYPTSLTALNDVAKTAPTSNQAIRWNAADQLWEPTSIGTSYIAWGAPYSYINLTFDAGVIPSYLVFNQTPSLVNDPDTTLGTTQALRLATDNLGNNANSYFDMTVEASDNVNTFSIRMKNQGEGGYDGLNIILDGATTMVSDRTYQNDYTLYQFAIPDGSHSIRCQYTSDSSATYGYEDTHFSQIIFPKQTGSDNYLRGDTVGHNGSIWFCLTDNSVQEPGTGGEWVAFGIPEAPNDGNAYVRKGGAWVLLANA